MAIDDRWDRYQRYMCSAESVGLRLDVSRMAFDDAQLDAMNEPIAQALVAMRALEDGATSNVGENRMVGHYWLRAPDLAPDEEIRADIRRATTAVKQFAADIHAGRVAPENADGFYVVLVIGIGGSALGPQFVCDALSGADDAMVIRFIDNTDPGGIDRVLAELDESLDQTLTIVISKSGRTAETRVAAKEVAMAYQRAGLNFARHAVAITQPGSELDEQATREKWLRSFPIWEWIGGRTSVLSPVGLLPAALQGVNVDQLIEGARDCDDVTRLNTLRANPAALIASVWYIAGEGCGRRNLVMLPYRDNLGLLSRYLRQLVMESIGKEKQRDGAVVHQGLTVLGHKGTTDQHSYVQQLRDGSDDFFVTFVRTLRDRESKSIEIDFGATAGDYLDAFCLGTRDALSDAGRQSMTLTLNVLDARAIGVLIALFERTVGLYAELIDVNAYDQPGVEAGKKAATGILTLQREVLDHLSRNADSPCTVDQIAEGIGRAAAAELIHHILEHACANPDHGVRRIDGTSPSDERYGID